MGGDELGERLLELVVGDRVVVDVQLLEDRLVEEASILIADAAVERRRVLHELQSSLQQFRPDREVSAHVVKLEIDPVPLLFDVVQTLADLGLGQCAFGSEVEEVLLLDF